MYTKQNLQDSLKNEIRIINHLFTKIPEGTMEYRPTAGQRSTLELLQYLTFIGATMMEHILREDMSIYGPASEAAKAVTPETFVEAMDVQEQRMVDLLATFSDEELGKEISMFGGPIKTKGVTLVDVLLKTMASYRLQLFLYAKQSGARDISTSNAWGGVDAPVK